jgi:hypothetical protein
MPLTEGRTWTSKARCTFEKGGKETNSEFNETVRVGETSSYSVNGDSIPVVVLYRSVKEVTTDAAQSYRTVRTDDTKELFSTSLWLAVSSDTTTNYDASGSAHLTTISKQRLTGTTAA